jgi:hypothetical protein
LPYFSIQACLLEIVEMETEQKAEVVADDVVGRNAVVHEDELAALKDSRERGMPVFLADRGKSHVGPWVVAASDHQAKLAMVDWVYPMTKLTKRQRDERYTDLLEAAFDHPPVQESLLGPISTFSPAEIDLLGPIGVPKDWADRDKMLEMVRKS